MEEIKSKIVDHRIQLYKERINPTVILNNSDFCFITKTQSVGNYQYDKQNQYFTFREQKDIHQLKKIDLLTFATRLDLLFKEILGVQSINIEFKEGKYFIYYIKDSKNEKKIYFTKSNKELFILLIDFYLYLKDSNLIQKAS